MRSPPTFEYFEHTRINLFGYPLYLMLCGADARGFGLKKSSCTKVKKVGFWFCFWKLLCLTSVRLKLFFGLKTVIDPSALLKLFCEWLLRLACCSKVRLSVNRMLSLDGGRYRICACMWSRTGNLSGITVIEKVVKKQIYLTELFYSFWFIVVQLIFGLSIMKNGLFSTALFFAACSANLAFPVGGMSESGGLFSRFG